jgi:uncharacterized protein (TIGR02996 family)
MNDEAAFLKALRDNPADDTVRLVYADWLDERDDPRAKFVRMRQQFSQLAARMNELAGQFDSAWLAAVGGPRTKPEDITQRSGRWVSLRELRQWRTYGGLLEGSPNDEINQQILRHAQTEAARGAISANSYLIPPVIRNRLQKGWDIAPRQYQFLPATACVGRFTSTPRSNDSNYHASELVIIWFQDEFAFPIDPAVREQIRAIDWEKHATDFDY